jgi:type II secretory pathway predicted ATPase ExeA
MYERHFGFRERPFALSPDPAFLYRSRKHGMALTMLEYGLINEAPIIVVTGEIGAGKTTLIRHLLNQFDDKTAVGLISNTHKAFGELIQWVSMAFGLPHEGKEKVALYQAFVDFLIKEYAKGKRTVLIVDEAQNMDADTLEELRVISNINADKHLVLQLILVGQPELRETLRRQLVKQYLKGGSNSRHGVLVILWLEDKQWDIPRVARRASFTQLVDHLSDYARTLRAAHPEIESLLVFGIDCRAVSQLDGLKQGGQA